MKIFFTFCFIFTFCFLNSQVKSASYDIKFNNKTNLYDAYLKIEKGGSAKKAELIQYNSQMSIFTPKGSQLKIVENMLPYSTNDFGEEVIGTWKVSNKVENVPIVNNQTIYSINPKVSPIAYFKELKQGHSYKLFSFSITPQPSCKDLVRLYDNIADHKDIPVNYKGGNFKNAYTLGGLFPIYDNTSKVTNVHEMSEIVLGPIKEIYEEGESLQVSVENKTDENSYYLSSKKGKKIISDLTIENLKPEASGAYKVIAMNQKGCIMDKEFDLTVKPQAVTEVVKPIVDKVSLYPNPVKDKLTLTVSTKVASTIAADIYDQSGRKVKQNIINEKNHVGEVRKSINLNLSAGLYIVKMAINGVQTNHSFIVVE